MGLLVGRQQHCLTRLRCFASIESTLQTCCWGSSRGSIRKRQGRRGRSVCMSGGLQLHVVLGKSKQLPRGEKTIARAIDRWMAKLAFFYIFCISFFVVSSLSHSGLYCIETKIRPPSLKKGGSIKQKKGPGSLAPSFHINK